MLCSCLLCAAMVLDTHLIAGSVDGLEELRARYVNVCCISINWVSVSPFLSNS